MPIRTTSTPLEHPGFGRMAGPLFLPDRHRLCVVKAVVGVGSKSVCVLALPFCCFVLLARTILPTSIFGWAESVAAEVAAREGAASRPRLQLYGVRPEVPYLPS